MKRCERCPYTRLVKVVDLGTDVEGRPATIELHWAKLCTSCEFIARAEVHEKTAKKLRERAARIAHQRNTR